jgi:hypothetical protein
MSYVTLMVYVEPDRTSAQQIRVAAHLANKRSNLAACGGISVWGVRAVAEDLEGTSNTRYQLIKINGLSYTASRIIWKLMRETRTATHRLPKPERSGMCVRYTDRMVASIGVSRLATSKLISAALPVTRVRLRHVALSR